MTRELQLTLLLGRCWRPLSENCACANTVYSRAEHVYVLEHYFASKNFAAVREAFSSLYPDKEVPNNTEIYRLFAFGHRDLQTSPYYTLCPSQDWSVYKEFYRALRYQSTSPSQRWKWQLCVSKLSVQTERFWTVLRWSKCESVQLWGLYVPESYIIATSKFNETEKLTMLFIPFSQLQPLIVYCNFYTTACRRTICAVSWQSALRYCTFVCGFLKARLCVLTRRHEIDSSVTERTGSWL
jgi:hypothetical protein